MADKKPMKKKREPKSLLERVADGYNSAARAGYLGGKAQVSATKERTKMRKKSFK